MEIRTFPFDESQFDQLSAYHYGLNWPVVYIQENGKEMYVGQTTNLYGRSRQHYVDPNRVRLKKIHVLTDEDFNMSSACDFESLLIQHVAADGLFKLQNANVGLVNHNYFERVRYQAKLEAFWPELKKLGLVSQTMEEIRVSNLFKYSPYKALSFDQLEIARELEDHVKKGNRETSIVNGGPGTGKTVLALFLLKLLSDAWKGKASRIALVVPMTSLRHTLKQVACKIPGLRADMVIGPSDAVNKHYDLLMVDEAHRLRRRINLTNFPSYDQANRRQGLELQATQLDWIIKSSKRQILFYDRGQSVTPADVRPEDFESLHAKRFELSSQMRILGGEKYLQLIDDLFELKDVSEVSFSNYEFTIYDDIHSMIREIKARESKEKLARLVAGYAWPWKTKGGKEGYDIEIDGAKLVWNRKNSNWVNSENAINEVGCIHTVQGYDLNYAGVIIGPDLSYDESSEKLKFNKERYCDFNGKRSISDPNELEHYIRNIYRTLLSRGIKGTFVYIVDRPLRDKFRSLLAQKPESTDPRFAVPLEVLSKNFWIEVPLVGSAPCGNPLLGQENIEKQILIEKSKLRSGFGYFILKAKGDSMNLAGIKDGDLVLCRQQLKADSGDKVVALLGDNVTIKIYQKKDGRRILLPKSTNKAHEPIYPEEGDVVQGIVQEVLVVKN